MVLVGRVWQKRSLVYALLENPCIKDSWTLLDPIPQPPPAILSLCPLISLQVSGALSVGSVAITAATAVPLFLAGVTSLGLNTLSFLNTVAASYTPEVKRHPVAHVRCAQTLMSGVPYASLKPL